jgi:pantothenate kinase-related protein Tda10
MTALFHACPRVASLKSTMRGPTGGNAACYNETLQGSLILPERGTDGSGRALLQTVLATGQESRQITNLVIEELADFYLTEVPNVGLKRQH